MSIENTEKIVADAELVAPGESATVGDLPDAEAPVVEPAIELTPLTTLVDGLPYVTVTQRALSLYADKLRSGTGPVAVDAERASGHRYGQHNYLVQIRREGSGTALIDTDALPALTVINEALAGVEWVFHAANQDLVPLAEQNLKPDRIFDTERAARLLGLPRVGLGAVVADVLGLELRKEHSAVDWSTRPLPEPWLLYAALDVEVLVELRDRMEERLIEAGKLQWAYEDFEAIRLAPPAEPRVEPWRRTSRITDLRGRHQLAIARELWQVRERLAQARDVTPGRVLPDRAIIQAAQLSPRTVPALTEIGVFASKSQRSRAPQWVASINKALALPTEELPTTRGPAGDGPPNPRSWAERNPTAAARLEVAKVAIEALSENHNVPLENLLQPDALRRLCWDNNATATEESIAEFLAGRGARNWQIQLVAPALREALTAAKL